MFSEAVEEKWKKSKILVADTSDGHINLAKWIPTEERSGHFDGRNA